MRIFLCLVCLPAFMPHPAPAQSRDWEKRTNGYVFVAPGAVSSSGESAGMLHFGAGGEGLLTRRLGIGSEIGYLGPTRGLSEGIGIFSVNAVYRFTGAVPGRRVFPFLTGGYSLGFRQGTLHIVNFGGGVQYWFRDRLGLRLEFRDHVSPEYISVHLWQGRIGLAFR